MDKAKEYLERVVEIWENADDDHEQAALAKKKLMDMQ